MGAKEARVGLLRLFLLTAMTLFCSATIWKHSERQVFWKHTKAYDLLVVAKLEIILHDEILIPGDDKQRKNRL